MKGYGCVVLRTEYCHAGGAFGSAPLVTPARVALDVVPLVLVSCFPSHAFREKEEGLISFEQALSPCQEMGGALARNNNAANGERGYHGNGEGRG